MNTNEMKAAGEVSKQPCSICDDTGNAFGKVCTCVTGEAGEAVASSARHGQVPELIGYVNLHYGTFFRPAEFASTERNQELLASGEVVKVCTLEVAPVAPVAGSIGDDERFKKLLTVRDHTTTIEQQLIATHALAAYIDSRAIPPPQPLATQAVPSEREKALEEAEEGSQMLTDFIASVNKHGNYSKESTIGFLTQAKQCFDAIRALASSPAAVSASVPEQAEAAKMTTNEAREYIVAFMERHFTDRTFHRYIRGERGDVNLAADFAWQMARALKSLATPSDHSADKQAEGK